MKHQDRLPLFLPVTFALLWASSYVTAKVGLEDISPILFVTIRLILATPALFAIAMVLKPGAFPGFASWNHLLVGGALIHGVTLMTAHIALITVKAAPLALVHAFHPVLTAALGGILLNEVFTKRQWMGMALGLLGVALAFPFVSTDWSVLGIVGLSLASLTGGTLYLKRFAPATEALHSTAIQLLGGAVASLAGLLVFETPHADWTPSLISVMAWNTITISIVGMVIYTIMLSRGQAGRAAAAFFIVPGSAAFMAWLALGQDMSAVALLGLALASFGVWLVWHRKPGVM